MTDDATATSRDFAPSTLLITRFDPRLPKGGGALRVAQLAYGLDQSTPTEIVVLGDRRESNAFGLQSRIELFDQQALLRSNPLLEKILRKCWLAGSSRHPEIDRYVPHSLKKRLARRLRSQKSIKRIILSELVLAGYMDLAPQAKVDLIYDAHNVEFLLREELNRTPSAGWQFSQRNRRLRNIEQNLYRHANITWVCSDTDRLLFSEHFGMHRNCIVLPNCIDVRTYEQDPVSEDSWQNEPTTLIYTGAYSYSPNEDAALTLINEIIPLVRPHLKKLKVVILGRQPTRAIYEAANDKPEVTVTGEVQSVRPFLSPPVIFTLPIRYGSGTRLKILEAFASRRPVVCTRKAAEGIAVEADKHVIFAESPAEFAESIARLAQNPKKINEIAENAFRLVTERYSWQQAVSIIHQSFPK